VQSIPNGAKLKFKGVVICATQTFSLFVIGIAQIYQVSLTDRQASRPMAFFSQRRAIQSLDHFARAHLEVEDEVMRRESWSLIKTGLVNHI